MHMIEVEGAVCPVDYQSFVASTMYERTQDDWQDMHARLMSGELSEVLGQHGNATMILWPKQMLDVWDGSFDISLENRYGLLDELMDLVWFNFAAAERYGLQARDVCIASLERHTSRDWSGIGNMAHLEAALSVFAADIKVPNKMQIEGWVDQNNPAGFVSLERNPLYVLLRTTHRTTRALEQGKNDVRYGGPPVATELEELVDVKAAMGDGLNALFYIISERFGWRVEDAMMFNATKLTERGVWGKPPSAVE